MGGGAGCMQSGALRDCSCGGGRSFHLFVDRPRVMTQAIKLQQGKRSSYRIKKVLVYKRTCGKSLRSLPSFKYLHI
jgi:hypothetical protein